MAARPCPPLDINGSSRTSSSCSSRCWRSSPSWPRWPRCSRGSGGFRRLLLTEKRDWPERLAFAGALASRCSPGPSRRILLGYNAADLSLAGPFLAGLLAGPYAGAMVGLDGRPARRARRRVRAPLPFAVGCGFAGGGLREICPKEAIWHFSPFVFTDLHRYAWRLLRRFEIDWQIILITPPILLELLRQGSAIAGPGASSCSWPTTR